MKVIVVAVSTLNGKLTKGEETDIYKWTSKEDAKIFFSLIDKHNLIVMGSKTYEAVRKVIKLKKDKLRIVLTRDPERFKRFEVKGQLEFSNDSSLELVKRMETQGFKTMLLVGGSTISTLFFQHNKIDEVWITLEPLIFGKGKGLIEESNLDVPLRLKSIKKLNKNGTILLKYSVIKPNFLLLPHRQ